MALQIFKKTPVGRIRYRFFAAEWMVAGASIATMVWAVQGDDAALLVGAQSETADVASVWLDAGTLDGTYTVEGTLTTDEAEPQTIKRSFIVAVVEHIYIEAA
jgi:hypothetical protein